MILKREFKGRKKMLTETGIIEPLNLESENLSDDGEARNKALLKNIFGVQKKKDSIPKNTKGLELQTTFREHHLKKAKKKRNKFSSLSSYDFKLHPQFRDHFIKKVINKVIEEVDNNESGESEFKQMKKQVFSGLFSLRNIGNKADPKLLEGIVNVIKKEEMSFIQDQINSKAEDTHPMLNKNIKEIDHSNKSDESNHQIIIRPKSKFTKSRALDLDEDFPHGLNESSEPKKEEATPFSLQRELSSSPVSSQSKKNYLIKNNNLNNVTAKNQATKLNQKDHEETVPSSEKTITIHSNVFSQTIPQAKKRFKLQSICLDPEDTINSKSVNQNNDALNPPGLKQTSKKQEVVKIREIEEEDEINKSYQEQNSKQIFEKEKNSLRQSNFRGSMTEDSIEIFDDEEDALESDENFNFHNPLFYISTRTAGKRIFTEKKKKMRDVNKNNSNL